MNIYSRRKFIQTTALLSGAMMTRRFFNEEHDPKEISKNKVPVYAHLWVYASRFPPDWDCMPIMDEVFSDLKYAGLQGVEVMEVHLRHPDAVSRFKELTQKYRLPVSGASYYGDMWIRKEHQHILEDLELVTERLHAIGGTTLGITVGDAQHAKTEEELDAQADLLKQARLICEKYAVEPNLHNHTFEVKDGMHDLKGTLARIPDIKLGPDLNWLIRAGVDPVWFIETYGHQIVYMHIRDQDSQGVWTEAVGEGVTDFPAIARAFQKIPYKGKAAIELAFDKPPVHPLREDWKKSRQYVKKVFGW
jgi:sugar phosphate isomerase/epimerase